MHRVCGLETKNRYLDITKVIFVVFPQPTPNKCQKSNTNGSCASELLATQRSSSFQTASRNMTYFNRKFDTKINAV